MKTSNEMINALGEMDIAERLLFFEYLFAEHYNYSLLAQHDIEIINELREGFIKVVEANAY